MKGSNSSNCGRSQSFSAGGLDRRNADSALVVHQQRTIVRSAGDNHAIIFFRDIGILYQSIHNYFEVFRELHFLGEVKHVVDVVIFLGRKLNLEFWDFGGVRGVFGAGLNDAAGLLYGDRLEPVGVAAFYDMGRSNVPNTANMCFSVRYCHKPTNSGVDVTFVVDLGKNQIRHGVSSFVFPTKKWGNM